MDTQSKLYNGNRNVAAMLATDINNETVAIQERTLRYRSRIEELEAKQRNKQPDPYNILASLFISNVQIKNKHAAIANELEKEK